MCDQNKPRDKKLKASKACACGLRGERGCICPKKCLTCGVQFQKGYDRSANTGHRCIVCVKPKEPDQFWKAGDPPGTDLPVLQAPYKLWAYDLESCVERETVLYGPSYNITDEHTFDGDGIDFSVTYVKLAKHKVNMVVFRNVFDDASEETYFGNDCLERFVALMLQTNHGKNICVAHNGSGYDSRLVFEAATKMAVLDKHKISPLARGNKFMELTLGRTIFRDSLLHLPGSLAGLAQDFFSNSVLRKGHFPHLFNEEKNYGYIGAVPDPEFFDLTYMIRDKKQLDDFHAWHDERKKTPWNFMDELAAYCKNDVKVLAALMYEYHTILVDKFKISPWFSTTAPSYVHKVIRHQLSVGLELSDDVEERKEQLEKYAWKTFWGVLKPGEYWFARRALRGGRTDIRKLRHHVSDEDWARGVRIRYQDIVSMYPYVQVARDYPVGLPTVEVWDPAFYPCKTHQNPSIGNVVDLNCGCSLTTRRNHCDRMMDIRDYSDCVAPSAADILNDDSFFGIVCASLDPPKHLFHPVLVLWDDPQKKCVASLEPIHHGVFTTPEFKKALEKGYALVKLHRLDRYHKKEGLWNDFIMDLYIEKMVNSEPTPSLEKQHQLVQTYEKEFGMGEAVEDSFPNWDLRPAKRKVFKIMLNSGWGKHCQRAAMDQMFIFGDTDYQDTLDLHTNLAEGSCVLKGYANMGSTVMVKVENDGWKTNPNLHEGYLPAGLFVPAWGRLMLYEQLDQLGERVLYHDTDSIIYIYDPDHYNIPESDVWGKWSVEKIDSRNGGLRTFVGFGPKSYGIRAENGTAEIKVKGLSLKLAHGKLFNFDVMDQMIQTYLANGEANSLEVPQMVFTWQPGKPMITKQFLKKIGFQPEILKGDLMGPLVVPKGYCVTCAARADFSFHDSCP